MKNKGKKKLKNILSVALALTMLLTAVPMSVSVAAAEELSETTEKVSNAVESAGASLGYMMLDAATEVGRQNLQQASIVNAMLTNSKDTVVSVADTLGNAITRAVTEGTYGDFKYCILEDGTAEIAKYKGQAIDVVIPSEINGYKVTSIGHLAFDECSSIQSITIPSSVTNIGYSVFSGCSSLICIEIPENVTSIGDATFYGCTSLTNVTMHENVCNIGDSMFQNCSSLKNITIPKSVTDIGYSAFYGCSSLTDIIHYGNINTIGRLAFSGCTSLENVYIKGSVNEIGESAFSNDSYNINDPCIVLKNIVIEGDINNVGKLAFSGCTSLENIVVKGKVNEISDMAFASDSSLKKVEIDGSVCFVGEKSFFGCSSLTEIELHGDVENIGDLAFSGCTSLENIIIEGDMGEIGYAAFSHGQSMLPACTSLKSVLIKGNVGDIGDNAFYGCSSLINVTFSGKKGGDIGDGAFFGCGSLKEINFLEGITTIGTGAFRGCISLQNVTIPKSVTNIGYSAFSGCSSLQNIKIPEGTNRIESYAFSNCISLEKVEIQGDKDIIGDGAFSECLSLTDIVILGNVNNIGTSAFSNCILLENIIIEGKVEDIGNEAFSSDTSLEKVAIEGGVQNVGDEAFLDCSSLTELTLHGNVENIGQLAFSGCISLENLIIEGNVGKIKYNAFSDNFASGGNSKPCIALKNVVIEGNVDYLGEFDGCRSLQEVSITGDIKDIGAMAFDGCVSLTHITFNDVDSIGYSAFSGCSSLIDIYIPEGITNIESSTFSGCSSLTNMNIPKSVTSIGSGAFYGCSSLVDINIPKGVNDIGSYAFAGCSSLKNLVIEANIESIGVSTFSDCTSLDSVTLPSSLISIGENAFYKCSSLRDIYYGGTKKEWENIDKAASRLPRNVIVHYSSNGAEAALSDYYVGTVEDANGNYAESWIKISGTIYPVSKQLFIVPEYMVGRKILYRLNSNGEIAKYSLETDPKIAKIKSYNPENQTLEIEGETTPCYLYKGLTDEDLMGESDLSNAVALVGRLVRYTTAPVYDDMGRQVVCLINADLIRTVAGKIKSLDVLSNPWQVYMEGANKAIPVDMSNESLQNELLNLQQKDAILTLVDGVICYAYDPLSLTSVNIVYSSVNPEEIEWKDKKYSADTIESTVTISFGFKSTSFVGESDVAKNYLKNESIILDRIDVSLVNLDMYKIDGNEVCESGTTINFGNSKSYTLKLKLKLFAGKPEHETDTGFIYVDVYTSSLSKKVSYPIDIQNIDLQEENRKKKEELEQKAQEEAKKMAKEAENAYAKLTDNGEETLFAFPPELYEYLDDDQIKSIELIILTQIALSKIPEEELSSDNDEIKKISDEIVEKVMNKYLGDWKPDVSVSSLNVPVLIQLESEEYGTIQCAFDCNLTNVSLKEKEFAMQGDFSVKVRLMDKNGKPTKNIPTKGIIVQTDIKSFADSIWNIASGQFKSAINILWGNDANKITNEIKQNGINAVANKMSPYIFNKPIQLILQKFYEKELKNSFSSNMYKILSYPSKLVSVHCPVDLYIYDVSGALAGSIINGEALSFTDDLSLWTDGDSKYVQMYGGDYQIVYMSTDSGTMDIEITEYANSDMNVQTVYFKNVPLDNGILYAGNIEETLNTQNKDYNLVSNFGNVIESDSIIENVPEENSKLPGDINGDGKVTAVDARWVLQIAAGTREVTEAERISVDLNGDGKVTAVDARWVLQIAAGTRVL